MSYDRAEVWPAVGREKRTTYGGVSGNAVSSIKKATHFFESFFSAHEVPRVIAEM
jgi:hypothetical protein